MSDKISIRELETVIPLRRRQCVKYAQNLGLDAQKAKAMRHMTHSIIPLTHKPNMPSVNLTH